MSIIRWESLQHDLREDERGRQQQFSSSFSLLTIMVNWLAAESCLIQTWRGEAKKRRNDNGMSQSGKDEMRDFREKISQQKSRRWMLSIMMLCEWRFLCLSVRISNVLFWSFTRSAKLTDDHFKRGHHQVHCIQSALLNHHRVSIASSLQIPLSNRKVMVVISLSLSFCYPTTTCSLKIMSETTGQRIGIYDRRTIKIIP